MGGKGGSTEVKETQQEKAAAQVAQKQWTLYQNELKPFENMFMEDVESLNDQSKYDNVAGSTNLQYQQQFGDARQKAAQQLTASGVDPSSGKFSGTMDNLVQNQVAGQIDTTNRAQTSQQDKYVAGLQDVTALGAGQKAEALSGFQSIANASGQRARQDAQTALSSQQATQGLVGAGLGAAASYGANNLGAAATKTPTSSTGVFGTPTSTGTEGGFGLSTTYKGY